MSTDLSNDLFQLLIHALIAPLNQINFYYLAEKANVIHWFAIGWVNHITLQAHVMLKDQVTLDLLHREERAA